MRMESKSIPTDIDLSDLGLDKIKETEDTLEIGSMCTLRQIELEPKLQAYLGGILSECVKPIVGVQFRNSATVGGSVYSRFGFSDVLTALLACETTVVLYQQGEVPLATFMKQPYEKDIVLKLVVKKEEGKGICLTERMSATDLPILTVAASKTEEGYRIVVGSRPSRAALATKAIVYANSCESMDEMAKEKIASLVIEELKFETNMRGSKAYREHLAKVLVKRALTQMED